MHTFTTNRSYIISYWGDFHQSLEERLYPPQPMWLIPMPIEEGSPAIIEAEDNDPSDSLKLFPAKVEKSFGEGSAPEGFTEMKGILLEAVETPTIAVQAV